MCDCRSKNLWIPVLRHQKAIVLVLIGYLFIWSSLVHAQEEINNAWIAKLPSGDKIQITNDWLQEDSTAHGKVTIDGKTYEAAAGTLKTGTVIMWRIQDFRLSSIHADLDVFPTNGITIQDALMVLVKSDGGITRYAVKELPKALRDFARKTLDDDDTLALAKGLNVFGKYDPSRADKNVKDAFGKFGTSGEILLGGSIGNILQSKPKPKVQLYATLPTFTYPKALEKIFTGSQRPTLFIQADEDSKEVSFGILNDVKLMVNRRSLEVTAEFFLTLAKDGIGIDVALLKDRWKGALGIEKLDLSQLKGQVGVDVKGATTFTMRGTILLEGKPNTMEVAAAIDPKTGIDPTELLFFLKTPRISLEQFMKFTDIIVGDEDIGKNSELAKHARAEGLYKSLELDKIPNFEIKPLKNEEYVQIIVSGPKANDPTLGVGGLGAVMKGQMEVWNTPVGWIDAKVAEPINTLPILDIKGQAEIRKIGPVDLAAAGMRKSGEIALTARFGEAPNFKIKSQSTFMGVGQERHIVLNTDKILFSEEHTFLDAATMRVKAETEGKKLSQVKSFDITGSISLNPSDLGRTIREALNENYDINTETVDSILKRIEKENKFFQLQSIRLSGSVSPSRRDTVEMKIRAMVAGENRVVNAELKSFDKTEVANAVVQSMAAFSERLLAWRDIDLNLFDRDNIRKHSDALYFYEGNNCRQEVVGTVNYGDWKIKASQKQWFQNDEARSLRIRKLKKGATIVLYDKPEASVSDDVTVIEILQNSDKGICIGSFETSKTREKYRVSVLKKNGLDGKVSYVRVSPEYKRDRLPSDIIFYEGKECSQGVKGYARSYEKQVYECKESKHCTNDEIKSMRIMRWGDRWKSGRGDKYAIYLYDDKDGDRDDDWAEIKVEPSKIEGSSDCISGFERDRTRKAFNVDYHKKNGLDGKISRISVVP